MSDVLIIKGAKVFSPDRTFADNDLYIRGEYICEKQPRDMEHEILDAAGMYAVPGLVDIHLHGAVGYDICDATGEALRRIAAYEAANGVLAICPATMTLAETDLCRVMRTVAAYDTEQGADLVGIHMEGPFLSEKKRGAQNAEWIKAPDEAMFRRLQRISGGRIRILDIAPETEGAISFIENCAEEVCVSLAHTEADYDTAQKAFQAGARHMTHLFNAMPGLGHRNPGPVAAAIEAGAEAELICDGIHVHPAMVRMAFSLFGADRIILISDSMRACGLQDGRYELGGQTVTVKGSKAVLTAQPETIAGSVTNLFACMRKAVLDMGIMLEDAVAAATQNPARAIGIDHQYGKLTAGCFANVLLLDSQLQLCGIIQKGKILFLNDAYASPARMENS